MDRTTDTSNRVLAYVLIGLGLLFLLARLSFASGWLWAGLVAAALLAAYVRQRRYGLLVAGSLVAGLAVGLLVGTWPGLMISLGVGFLVVEVLEPGGGRWPRYAAAGAAGVGLLGWLLESGFFGSLLFALLLIGFGLYLLSRRDAETPSTEGRFIPIEPVQPRPPSPTPTPDYSIPRHSTPGHWTSGNTTSEPKPAPISGPASAPAPDPAPSPIANPAFIPTIEALKPVDEQRADEPHPEAPPDSPAASLPEPLPEAPPSGVRSPADDIADEPTESSLESLTGESGANGALRLRLERWRRETAAAEGRAAYLILTNDTLGRLAAERPRTLEALGGVRGIGPVKLERYGPRLLEIIAAAA